MVHSRWVRVWNKKGEPAHDAQAEQHLPSNLSLGRFRGNRLSFRMGVGYFGLS